MDHPQWLLPGDPAPDKSATSDYFLQASPQLLVLQFEQQFGIREGSHNRVLLSTQEHKPVAALLQYYAQYAGLPANLEGLDFSCLNATLHPSSTPAMWSMEQGDVIRVYTHGGHKAVIENYTQGQTPEGQFRCNFRGCGLLFKENSDELLRHMNVHYNTAGLFYCTHGNCPLVFTLESELESHLAEHTALSPLVNLAMASPPRPLMTSISTQTTPEGPESPVLVTKTDTSATSTDDANDIPIVEVKTEPTSPVTQEASPLKVMGSSQSLEEGEDEDDEDSGEETDRAFRCPEPDCGARFERRIQLAEHRTMKHPSKVPNNRLPTVRKTPWRGNSRTIPTKETPKRSHKKGANKNAVKPDGRSSSRLAKKGKGSAPEEEDRPHICEFPGCGMTFKRGEHLKRHFSSKHSTTKFYICPVKGCDREFTRKDNRNQHLGRHIRNKDGLKDIERAGLLRHLKGLSPPPQEPEPPSYALNFVSNIPRKRTLSTSKKVDKTLIWRQPEKSKKRKTSATSQKDNTETPVITTRKEKVLSLPTPTTPRSLLKKEKSEPPPPTPQNAPTIPYAQHTRESVSQHEKENKDLGSEEYTGPRTRSAGRRQRPDVEPHEVEEPPRPAERSQQAQEGKVRDFEGNGLLHLLEQAAEAIDERNSSPNEAIPEDVIAVAEELSRHMMKVPENTPPVVQNGLPETPHNQILADTTQSTSNETEQDASTDVFEDAVEHQVKQECEEAPEDSDDALEGGHELQDLKDLKEIQLLNLSSKSRSSSVPLNVAPLSWISYRPAASPSESPTYEPQEVTSPLPTSPITPVSKQEFTFKSTKKPLKRPRTLRYANFPSVCCYCHATSSTQWRHGPDGERLCNACGLYYSKHGRKRAFKTSPIPEPPKPVVQFVQVAQEDSKLLESGPGL